LRRGAIAGVCVAVLGQIDNPAADSVLDACAFYVRGWIAVDEGQTTPDAIEIWYAGRVIGETRWFYPRPDVVAATAVPADRVSGFFAFSCQADGLDGSAGDLGVAARFADGTRTPVLFPRVVRFLPATANPLTQLRQEMASDHACGLEIGAHSNPTRGLTPFYTDAWVDFAGTKGRADFLSDACALPIASDALDYLCSSHVIEHLPNPLQALFEWHRVLRPGGLLYLIAPDKRYTFDVRRKLTSPRHLLADFRRQITAAESTEHLEDFVANSVWSLLRPGSQPENEATERAAARAEYRAQLSAGGAVDIHFHTFTPESLHQLLEIAGLIGGPSPKFTVACAAERYPGDREDGLACLLRKTGPARRVEPLATFHLVHPRLPHLRLPLVDPVSLAPLHYAPSRTGDVLRSSTGGTTYVVSSALPQLRCAPGHVPARPWSSALARWLIYLGGIARKPPQHFQTA
jgi:SAM-dependent methyltransferase